MGWSDISISMTGPIVNSTILHFEDRWSVCQPRDTFLTSRTDLFVGTTSLARSTTQKKDLLSTRRSSAYCTTNPPLVDCSQKVKRGPVRCLEVSTAILPIILDASGVRNAGSSPVRRTMAHTFRCAEGECLIYQRTAISLITDGCVTAARHGLPESPLSTQLRMRT